MSLDSISSFFSFDNLALQCSLLYQKMDEPEVRSPTIQYIFNELSILRYLLKDLRMLPCLMPELKTFSFIIKHHCRPWIKYLCDPGRTSHTWLKSQHPDIPPHLDATVTRRVSSRLGSLAERIPNRRTLLHQYWVPVHFADAFHYYCCYNFKCVVITRYSWRLWIDKPLLFTTNHRWYGNYFIQESVLTPLVFPSSSIYVSRCLLYCNNQPISLYERQQNQRTTSSFVLQHWARSNGAVW